MLFHFEYAGPTGWEPLGSAIGSGADAVEEAFEELRELSGGELPSGDFRCLGIEDREARWISFEFPGEIELRRGTRDASVPAGMGGRQRSKGEADVRRNVRVEP